jgi:hypothetical protein
MAWQDMLRGRPCSTDEASDLKRAVAAGRSSGPGYRITVRHSTVSAEFLILIVGYQAELCEKGWL